MYSVLSPTFIIGHIYIGSVEGASCVNLGNNAASGFRNFEKTNQGFGNVSGDRNRVSGVRSMLDAGGNAEWLDGDEGEEEAPDWVKQLLNAAGVNTKEK